MISRSIFDPGNPNVERSGNTLTPADGRTISKMPEDVIDGYIEEEETAEFGGEEVGFNAKGQPEEASGVESQAGAQDAAAAGQTDDGGRDDAAGQDSFENAEEPRRPWPGDWQRNEPRTQ